MQLRSQVSFWQFQIFIGIEDSQISLKCFSVFQNTFVLKVQHCISEIFNTTLSEKCTSLDQCDFFLDGTIQCNKIIRIWNSGFTQQISKTSTFLVAVVVFPHGRLTMFFAEQWLISAIFTILFSIASQCP